VPKTDCPWRCNLNASNDRTYWAKMKTIVPPSGKERLMDRLEAMSICWRLRRPVASLPLRGS